MTDTTSGNDLHTSAFARKRVRQRYRRQNYLKAAGIAAIAIAGLALVTLLYSVLHRAVPVLQETTISLNVQLDGDVLDPDGKRDRDTLYGAPYSKLIKKALKEKFPGVRGRERRKLYKLVSDGASYRLRDRVVADPSLIGKTLSLQLLADDDADLFASGRLGRIENLSAKGALQLAGDGSAGEDVRLTSSNDDFVESLAVVKAALIEKALVLDRQARNQARAASKFAAQASAEKDTDKRAELEERRNSYEQQQTRLEKQAAALRARAGDARLAEALDETLPTIFVRVNGGLVKASEVGPNYVAGTVVFPLSATDAAKAGSWQHELARTPEANRKLTDLQLVVLRTLQIDGELKRNFNWSFFSSADASEPEEAGILGGLLGTFWTMVVTFLLAFPAGVLGALYLEELAPRNAVTHFLEVLINNLAAIPSIVFGLLGLVMFVNFFGLPYSSSLVGGIVLALMTLPTVIIASRAAIKAVPPSIREAALGVGASKMQTVFQHVLPLAMPGILTGSIIGMAQALGETAPLLMIGMVAFIVDPPTAVTDSAASLPVLIYLWADRAEVAFDARTAAAIVVLLLFLLVMNGLAILLRRKFERRW